jgi:hypothetical protein
MIGPAVLGMLGRQRLSSGLDAIGLADLLSSQRRKIAGAIPQGLAEEMNASGLGDALKDRPYAQPVGGARTAAGPRVTRATTTTTGAKAAPRRASNAWLYWLLGLAALAALAFWAIGNSVNREVRPAAVESESLVVGGVNLRNEVDTAVDSLRTTLGGITDEASARAALPDLRNVTTQLENVSTLARQLPADGRRELASVTSGSLPAIEREFDRILGMPGVAGVVRPVIEGLRTRMRSLAEG